MTDQQTSRTNITEALRERLAALEHEQWERWSRTVAEQGLTPERIERWQRFWMPYEQLDEPTKDFDREWADKVLAILAAEPRSDAVTAPDPEADDARCGCGAIGVAAHTNAEHYAVTAPDEPIVDLPLRVVVDANGAYWRDYGTHYSMCPVSEDNDAIVVLAAYEPREARAASASVPLLDAATEGDIRYLLWVLHGHEGRYGDDGEMQCGWCHLDYRRDPLSKITAHLTSLSSSLDRYAAETPEQGRGDESR